MKYELLEHTADLKVRVHGENFIQLLGNAAFAMCDLMLPGSKKADEQFEISVAGDSREQIMVRFLNELIFVIQSKYVMFREFDIEQKDNCINAICRGYRMEATDRPDYDIKGVTYHDLVLQNDNGHYIAELVLDI